jgi:hypothetical protein
VNMTKLNALDENMSVFIFGIYVSFYSNPQCKGIPI